MPDREHGAEHEQADDDDVGDPVAAPAEQPEGAERAVDEGRVEQHQPAGQHRDRRLHRLQAHHDDDDADEVLRRLVQPERPQHPIRPCHAHR